MGGSEGGKERAGKNGDPRGWVGGTDGKTETAGLLVLDKP